MIVRKWIAGLLLVAGMVGVGRCWYLAKDGFHINRIRARGNAFQQEEPHKGIAPLLQQCYHYLGRGRQCYAFVSEDGRYVLKVPRIDRYFLPFFLRSCPVFNSYKERIFIERQRRMSFTWNSLQISAHELARETAVCYLHLGITQSLPRSIILYDRLGRSHQIDPNLISFVIQEKKELMMPLCVQAIQKGDRALAEQMLRQYVDIVAERGRKGVFNRDPSFLKNFGWDGQRAIQIDIGSFWRKKGLSAEQAYCKSLTEGTERFRQWLSDLDSELFHRLDAYIEQKLETGRSLYTETGSKIGNLTRRRPDFEPGEAGVEAAQLEYIGRCSRGQKLWLPTSSKTDF